MGLISIQTWLFGHYFKVSRKYWATNHMLSMANLSIIPLKQANNGPIRRIRGNIEAVLMYGAWPIVHSILQIFIKSLIFTPISLYFDKIYLLGPSYSNIRSIRSTNLRLRQNWRSIRYSIFYFQISPPIHQQFHYSSTFSSRIFTFRPPHFVPATRNGVNIVHSSQYSHLRRGFASLYSIIFLYLTLLFKKSSKNKSPEGASAFLFEKKKQKELLARRSLAVLLLFYSSTF